jgi:hypothetical protein
MRLQRLTPVLVGLAASLLGLAAADALPAAPAANSCFNTSSWSGWKGAPDDKAIYIRVSGRRVYASTSTPLARASAPASRTWSFASEAAAGSATPSTST